VPIEIRNFESMGGIRGANVTWKLAERCAGPGYFLAGDSCIVIDPSVARGVLRGLYSGILASNCILEILSKTSFEDRVFFSYQNLMKSWFMNDLLSIQKIYKNNNLL
jgi:flavin-dependent dehydrogenase